MMVLDALKDKYAKGAAWGGSVDSSLTVTVFADGDTLPEALLTEYKRRAGIVMGPMVAIVIQVVPGGPPTTDVPTLQTGTRSGG